VPPPKPKLAQILLGLFIVWQILFMLSANILEMIPPGRVEEDELSDLHFTNLNPEEVKLLPGRKEIDFARNITDWWSQVTGQIQMWSLFAPTFPIQASFPLVELQWDTGGAVPSSVRLPSFQDPVDPGRYFRWSGSDDRLLHYEMRLELIFSSWGPESRSKYGAAWRDALKQRVWRQRKSICAYLSWKARNYMSNHPELPPPRVSTLYIRIYSSPALGAPRVWGDAVEVPLAQMEHQSDATARINSLKFWNPVIDQFEPIFPHEESATDE
jgi:hypothetical protein